MKYGQQMVFFAKNGISEKTNKTNKTTTKQQ